MSGYADICSRINEWELKLKTSEDERKHHMVQNSLLEQSIKNYEQKLDAEKQTCEGLREQIEIAKVSQALSN